MSTNVFTPHLKMTFASFQMQLRVINALVLRETRTLYGHESLGFLWAFLEPIILLAPLMVIFTVTGMAKHLPFGMTMPGFIITGEGAWLLFSTTILKMLPSVKSNRTLLTYPQVTPLDIMIARAILNGMAKLTVFIVLVLGFSLSGLIGPIYSLSLLLQGLATGWLLGLGLGVVAASVSIIFPSVENFIAATMRLLFFISGIFFTFEMVPPEARPYILLNPFFHVIEITRRSFCPTYTHNGINIIYPAIFGIVALFLGMIFERNVRAKIELL